MTECGTDAPTEHVLSQEDAVCCLVLHMFFVLLVLFSFPFCSLNERNH